MTRLTYTAVAASVLLALGACQQQTPPSTNVPTPPSSPRPPSSCRPTPPSSSSSTTTTTRAPTRARRARRRPHRRSSRTVVLFEHDFVAVGNDVIVVHHDNGLHPRNRTSLRHRGRRRARAASRPSRRCYRQCLPAGRRFRVRGGVQGEAGTSGVCASSGDVLSLDSRAQLCASPAGPASAASIERAAASFQAESVVCLTHGSPQPN